MVDLFLLRFTMVNIAKKCGCFQVLEGILGLAFKIHYDKSSLFICISSQFWER